MVVARHRQFYCRGRGQLHLQNVLQLSTLGRSGKGLLTSHSTLLCLFKGQGEKIWQELKHPDT